jgi:hypothetical protein
MGQSPNAIILTLYVAQRNVRRNVAAQLTWALPKAERNRKAVLTVVGAVYGGA